MAGRARGGSGVPTGREPEARADGRARARDRGPGGSGARLGLAVELIAPRDAQVRVPLLETKGVKACAWVPTDGYAEPYTLAMALARAARRLGVRMRTQTPATAITIDRGRVTGVRSEERRVGQGQTLVDCR